MALSKWEQEYLKRLQSAWASKESMAELLRKRREKEKAQEPWVIGKTIGTLQNIGAGAIQAGGELAVGLPWQLSRLAPWDQSADQSSFFNKTQRLLEGTKQSMAQEGVETEWTWFWFGKWVMNIAWGSVLGWGAGNLFSKLGLKMATPTWLAWKTAISAGRWLREWLWFDLASGETPWAGTVAGTAIGALIPWAGTVAWALWKTASSAWGYLSKITPKINTSKVGAYTEKVMEAGKRLATWLKDTASVIGEQVSRIPSNIKTNVATQKATQEIVSKLPKVAQTAVRDGVDIADASQLPKVIKNIKPQAKQLLKAIKEFETNPRWTNPIEIVGKPITQKLKQLETARLKAWSKLGQVAETLPKVSSTEALNSVFDAIKKVPWLNGIKIKWDGILDFANTTLATSLTKWERTAIQKVFNDATKAGTGKAKHLLRQELFEVLWGKKKSLANMTDTQEKAFDAVRKWLSDLLESKSGQYKTLSNDYRKIIQPLSEMRKFMKTLPDATEDILDMKWGLLARRLTSNAVSNPQVRQLLRNLDKVAWGKTTESVEAMQDLYNILDKYYNIAGKTGFKWQVQSGIESSIKWTIAGAVKNFAGQSEAVVKKAIDDLMDDLLR